MHTPHTHRTRWVPLLALALLGAQGSAMAQSQVSLFGVVDAYLGHASGSLSRTQMGDGGEAASRFGFRGVEDLGQGWRVRFVLESGLKLGTGAGDGSNGAMNYGRQSFVGIDGPWGALDLGRGYTPMFIAMARADPYQANAVFSPLHLRGQVDAQKGLRAFASRGSNMLRYMTPKADFFANAAYAFGGGGAPSARSGELYGASVGYDRRPFYLAYSFQHARSGSAEQPVLNPDVTRHQAISASYELTRELQLNAHLGTATSSLPNVPKAKLWAAGAAWHLSAANRFTAEVVSRKIDGSPRAQLAWTIGWDHALSKRTALYGRFMRVNNHGGSSVSLGQIPIAANSGASGRLLALGIRHNF